MRRILAASDGSRHGEHAVAIARMLALQSDGEVLRYDVDAEGVAGLLPGVEIVRRADEWEADLVVLGRHSRTPEQPRHLGAISDRVIRRRTGLSLFVPLECRTLRRAVIAVDGSMRGLGVVPPAIAFLNFNMARAAAICVLPGSQVHESDSDWIDPREERVAGILGRLELASGRCETMVQWGDPLPDILRTIVETAADLLVLGVRRGGQRGDSGSGYVGRELLRSAPCAILTVPI